MNTTSRKYLILIFITIPLLNIAAEDDRWGWQFSPEIRLTTLDKELMTMVGGQTGVEYKQWYLCSAFYFGISNIKTDMEVTEGEYDGYTFGIPRNLIYGGGSVGRYFFKESTVEPHLGLLIGGGFSKADNDNDAVFILEPRAGLDIQLFPLVKLSGILSYRITIFSNWFPNSWVSGLNTGIAVKFGR